MVSRILPPVAAQMPGPMTLGATGSPDAAYEVGKATAEMLQYFGINMNYAPIGDTNNEPLNPVIGVRSPGDDPEKVAQFASACARGLRELSVVPCIKHFPGHGDTAVDSHYGLPVIQKTRQEMEKLELVPFRRAAAEGIEMVMTAHISLPKLTGTNLPATLAPEALKILRDELKYDGVIMTDCLEMDGVRATYGTVEGALMSLQAGADNVMICHTYEVQAAAIDHVCSAVNSGEISAGRIDESLGRLERLKARFTNWDKATSSQPAEILEAINTRGESLAHKLYADGVTLVRSAVGALPLSPSAKTVFVAPGLGHPTSGVLGVEMDQPTRAIKNPTNFHAVLQVHNPDVASIQFDKSGLSAAEWQQIEQADTVILATHNALQSKYQRETGVELAKRCGSKLVAVAACAPYDFLDVPEVKTYLAMYEPTVEAFKAVADILYGASEARGSLPVKPKSGQ